MTMQTLRGDVVYTLRTPMIAGVPRYGVSWVRVWLLVSWACSALVAMTVIHLASVSSPVSPTVRSFEALLLCVGIVLMGLAMWKASRLRQYGRLPLTLDPPVARRGALVRLRIALAAPLPSDAQLTARVSCVRFQFRQNGRSYEVLGETVWESQTPLGVAGAEIVEAAVVLPVDRPANSLPNGINYSHVAQRNDIHGWLLEVFDEAGRTPVRGYYRLPVE